LASVFTSILQQLHPSDWRVLLTPRGHPRLDCVCATCVGLELTDTVDFLHELFFIFLMSHSWPAYPSLHANDRTFKYHNFPTYLVTPLYAESNREQPWVEMLALQSTVELKIMRVLFEECLRPFFMCNSPGRLDPSHAKSRLLIKLLQRCLGTFVTSQPHLWLEELPTITMVATAPRLPNGCLGDLRVLAGKLLEEVWQAVGQPHQSHYMEFFIPTVMNMSTEPVSELRKICVKLIVDMLRVNPLAAEPFLIREVDRVMNWALPEFSTEMLALLMTEVPDGAIENLSRRTSFGLRRGVPVKPSPSNLALTAEKSKTRILSDLIKQINYLWEYSEVITRRSKLSGMLAINNLRTYYDSIKRKDMTIRYLFKLEELHEQSENDIERGYTLERISGQYNWSSNPVDISEVSNRYAQLGSASSSTLKEALLLDALKYLKEGGDWKRAIEVCDQLIVFYRDVTADLASLSKILTEQSQLYTKFISGDTRNQCCYKYYALHFTTRPDSPGFIGNTIVYRTLSQLNEVKMTLCEQFPEYHVETNNPQPLTSTETQITNDAPTIRLVSNLHPVPEIPANWATGEAAANLSPHIKAYYGWNQVRQFTRTYHFKPSKSADGKEMPVVEEVRYTLSDKLPNIRTLSKVEYAINTVQDMSLSLSANIADISSSPSPGLLLSNFVGKLSTSIHSPVSGGLTALLTSLNLVDDSLDERQSEQLSDAVFHLLEVQAEGLMLCRNFETTSEAAGSIANLLPTMIEQYNALMHEMSMKFGISVSRLKEKMELTNPIHTALTPVGGSAPSLYQTDRVYRRATQVLNPAQQLRSQDLSLFSDDENLTSPLSPPPDQRKVSSVSIIPPTPPPLPERPSDLFSLNGGDSLTSGNRHSRKFSFNDTASTSTPTSRFRLTPASSTTSLTLTRRPPCPLPLEPDSNSPDVTQTVSSNSGDDIPPPLPKKPPKPLSHGRALSTRHQLC
uniref:DOCKER domain-containing protein n=1 Tax=Rodentolepis nana TaxID=102285 RepID=A0A0R3TUC0_RODNA